MSHSFSLQTYLTPKPVYGPICVRADADRALSEQERFSGFSVSVTDSVPAPCLAEDTADDLRDHPVGRMATNPTIVSPNWQGRYHGAGFRNQQKLRRLRVAVSTHWKHRPNLGEMGTMRPYVLTAFLRPSLSPCFPRPVSW